MDALSPNTAALLSYLSANGDPSFSFDEPVPQKYPQSGQPQSLPPSAFFNMPIPGRDTPELTPESSNPASESPDALKGMAVTDSDEDRTHSKSTTRKTSDSATVNKRKAGHGHTVQEEPDDEDDDSGSDDPNGHEDKRAHGNDKASSGAGAGSGRRGGRKSVGGEGGNKELSKAAKRKEQNRAAQKAFRDRREAKVKDLEDKINALETKSYGAATENENLRGILKRLQEENVALKQAAFTFSMPASGNATPTTTSSSIPQPNAQRPKPPSPPLSSDDNLRSIHEIPGLANRKSSGGMVESPDSLLSATSATSAKPFDNAELFNAYAMGVRPEWARDLPANQAVTAAAQNGAPQTRVSPTSISPESTDPFAGFASSTSSSSLSPLAPLTPGGKSELDALWASFYPNGIPSILPQQNGQSNTTAQAPQSSVPPPQPQSFTNTPQGQSNPYVLNPWNVPIDKMAFRDQTPAPNAAPAQPQAASGGDPWANLNESNINDFLASLNGTNDVPDPMYDFEQADDFNSQLQKLLEESGGGASPSAAFNLSPNAFSPTAYLNLSPSPNASGSGSGIGSGTASNAQSPVNLGLARHASGSMSSLSNSASPESSGSGSSNHYPAASAAVNAFTAGPKPCDVVHVIGADGQRLKPSELWVLMGMQHNSSVDNLVIDDLCDQMKNKAVCADGGYTIDISDAENVFKHRSTYRQNS